MIVMSWFDNTASILVFELILLVILLTFIVHRINKGTKLALEKDLQSIENFLNKIDTQSLIKLSEIEDRSSDDKDNIRDKVEEIIEGKKYIQQCKNKDSEVVRLKYGRIKECLIDIFNSSTVISKRHPETIKAPNHAVIDKIDNLLKEQGRVK